MRLLLEAGADKDFANNNGDTALMIASRDGHLEAVRLLLEAGANEDIADTDGDTALMIASLHGYLEVVRLLLEARCRQGPRQQQRRHCLDDRFSTWLP